MPTVTLNMKAFDNIRGSMTQAMVDNINKSPTMAQQLVDYNNEVIAGTANPITFSESIGKQGSFFTSTAGKSTIYLTSADDWATGKSYTYLDGSGVSHTITAVGEFQGVLAHELGHYKSLASDNAMLASVKTSDPDYKSTVASIGMYGEGEGAYNNWVIRNETKANGGSEVEVRGSNYQFGNTQMNNVWSNMLATMDSVAASNPGMSESDRKIALSDAAGSYIALQKTSNTGQIYWDYYMSSLGGAAPSGTAQVIINDANKDGKADTIIETRNDGSKVISVNTSTSFNGGIDGATVNVAGATSVLANGKGITVNGGQGSYITLGGNGNFTSDAVLDVVNFGNNWGTVNISAGSRANIYTNGLNYSNVFTYGDTEAGVYGTGFANIHPYDGTSAIWAGNLTGVTANTVPHFFVSNLGSGGGILTVADNSMVSYDRGIGTIYVGSNSYVKGSNSGGENVYLNGTHSQLNNQNNGSNIYANGDHNLIDLHGTQATVYNNGAYNYVNNYGKYDHVYQYGSYEYVWTSDPTLTVYNSNGTDTSLGNPEDEYWIFYGFGGNKDAIKSAINSGSVLLNSSFSNVAESNAAQREISDLQATIKTGVISNPTGARWDHTTITWSFGSAGGNIGAAIVGEYKHIVEKEFSVWQNLTGIHFVEVKDGTSADVSVGWGHLNTAANSVLGLTSFATDKNGHMQSGATIQLEDPSDTALVKTQGDQFTYQGTDATLEQVLLHEVGHILGLGSSADPTSVENFVLGADNRSVSSSDIQAIFALYPELGHSPATLIGPTWGGALPHTAGVFL